MLKITDIIHIPLTIGRQIKRTIKLKQFRKLATCGERLSVGPESNISVESGSLVTIGHHCDIIGSIIAKCNSHISIGDFTTIRGNSIVGAACRITIGNYVIISNNVHIYDNNNHPTPPYERIKLCESGFYSALWHWSNSAKREVIICDNVWIGERSTILKGVTIGKGSIIACDSVVTHSVPEHCIVAGNPAKVVKYLESDRIN